MRIHEDAEWEFGPSPRVWGERWRDLAGLGPWGAMEQWMQLRFIVRGIGHRAATIWASSTATLFVLFAAATGTAFVSTRFRCLQPDCLPAEGAAIQSPQQSLALGQDGI
jgi:hypothetical protein